MQIEPQERAGTVDKGGEEYRISLTTKEYQYLLSFLPKGYSFQSEVKLSKKANKLSKQQKKQNEQKPRLRKIPSTMVYNQQIQNSYQMPKLIAGRRSSFEAIDQELKPCHRIINLLKNNKNSWPFREPVDPIAMCIPNYRDIIQQPMDLLTVENNLKMNQYLSASQFHADINKIIRNSYTFNHNNIEYFKLTEQFQKYYFKIISQSTSRAYQQQQTPTLNTQKSKKGKKKSSITLQPKYSTEFQPPTLAEKKQLTAQIMRLNKEDLKGVIQIVYTSQQEVRPTFDIEDLDHNKIRELQRYVRSKHLLQDSKPAEKNQHQSTHEVHQQSSFSLEDSD